MNKIDISNFFRSASRAVSKHSPEILTGMGIAGMITTTVLAVRATPKALTLIDDEASVKGEPLTKVEVVKAAWKPYIPAIVTGTMSTVCLIGASKVSTSRNAALLTAYKLSETALAEYREKVVETIGEKKEQEVRHKVAKEKLIKNPPKSSEIIITGKGNTLCYDPLSDRHFRSDLEIIRRAEITLNKEMINSIGGMVTLNDFYNEIGLGRIDIGDDIGWTTDNMIDLDISSHITENDEHAAVIGHYHAPKWSY